MSKLKVLSKKNLKEIKGGQKDIVIDDLIVLSRGIKDEIPTIKSSNIVIDDIIVLP